MCITLLHSHWLNSLLAHQTEAAGVQSADADAVEGTSEDSPEGMAGEELGREEVEKGEVNDDDNEFENEDENVNDEVLDGGEDDTKRLDEGEGAVEGEGEGEKIHRSTGQ